MIITQNGQTLHVFKNQFEHHYILNSAVADVAINKQIITLVLKSGDNKIVAIDFEDIIEIDGVSPTTFTAFVVYIGLWLTSSTLATEATLMAVLNAIIASDQDVEVLLVRDTGAGDIVVQQIINYETGTPIYSYKDVNGNIYVPVGPLVYLDPSAVLNLMLTELVSLNTTDFSTETTLSAISAKFNSLGQKASAASAPVVLSTEQEAILDATKTAIETLAGAGGGATETTLQATNALLTTIDAVLDSVKIDTGNIATDIASLETLTTAANALLTTIDADTGAIATDVAAIEVLITTTNALITTIDGVLDNIKTNTDVLTVGTRTHNTVIATGSGTVSTGSIRGSVFNSGSTSGTWNGISLPAGVSIPWGQVGIRDIYSSISYDATGTTFVIEYTT